jgi:hypothetical protein
MADTSSGPGCPRPLWSEQGTPTDVTSGHRSRCLGSGASTLPSLALVPAAALGGHGHAHHAERQVGVSLALAAQGALVLHHPGQVGRVVQGQVGCQVAGHQPMGLAAVTPAVAHPALATNVNTSPECMVLL